MNKDEKTIRDYNKMTPYYRASVVRIHHRKNKHTVRKTAEVFGISVGTAFNMINMFKRFR